MPSNASTHLPGHTLRGRVLRIEDDVMRVQTAEGIRSGDVIAGIGVGDLIAEGKVVHEGGEHVFRLGGDVPAIGPRLQTLAMRSAVLRSLRDYFYDQDFIEVDTPVCVTAPTQDLYIQSIRCEYASADGQSSPGNNRQDRWLITSPEYAMKRLLASGMGRIFYLGKCFRQAELGALHNPEFTMLEWYRAWESLDAIVSDAIAFVRRAATAVKVSSLRWQGVGPGVGPEVGVDPMLPWETIPLSVLFRDVLGTELDPTQEDAIFIAKMRACGVVLEGNYNWHEAFDQAFDQKIVPWLSMKKNLVVVTEWPARLPSLAKKIPEDPRWVARAEIYCAGVELANGFFELTCPAEQKQRFDDIAAARSKQKLPTYPIDEKFLAALRDGMPPSAGMALGVDRLLLLLSGASSINDVLPLGWKDC